MGSYGEDCRHRPRSRTRLRLRPRTPPPHAFREKHLRRQLRAALPHWGRRTLAALRRARLRRPCRPFRSRSAATAIELTEIEGALTASPVIDHAVVLVRTVVGKKTLAPSTRAPRSPICLVSGRPPAPPCPHTCCPTRWSGSMPSRSPATARWTAPRWGAGGQGTTPSGAGGARRRAGGRGAARLHRRARHGTGPRSGSPTTSSTTAATPWPRCGWRPGSAAGQPCATWWPGRRPVGLAAGIRAATTGDRPLLTDLTEAAGRRVERAEVTIVASPSRRWGGELRAARRALADGGRPVRVLGVDFPAATGMTSGCPSGGQLVEEHRLRRRGRDARGLVGAGAQRRLRARALATGLALRRMGHNLAQFVAVAAVLPSPGFQRSTDGGDREDADTRSSRGSPRNTGLREAAELPVTERADRRTGPSATTWSPPATASLSCSAIRGPPRSAARSRCSSPTTTADRDRHAEAGTGDASAQPCASRPPDGGSHYLNATRRRSSRTRSGRPVRGEEL
ncbi:hypothetical protein JOF35_005239 [Streptomyces demainii]|uniref:Uncharacterized protein n=1 Tax=Streptomyces demainii TaxID=588122 RepID=A0ABT9KWZ9_9ACTN|nr:hypothetical protein [Streptomyces demainii]